MTVLALLMSICAMAQDVESALAKFDKQTSVAAANLFFSELLKAEFVDEETVFPDGTPADSLKQQVWYWAGEWMYDQQQYERAEAYALKALPLCHVGNDFKADCLNLLGLIYVRMGDVKNAANYAKPAEQRKRSSLTSLPQPGIRRRKRQRNPARRGIRRQKRRSSTSSERWSMPTRWTTLPEKPSCSAWPPRSITRLDKTRRP